MEWLSYAGQNAEARERRRRLLSPRRSSLFRVEFCRSVSPNFAAPSSPISFSTQHHKLLNLCCRKRKVVVCNAEAIRQRRRLISRPMLSSFRVESCRSALANFAAPSTPMLFPAQHHERLNLYCGNGVVVVCEAECRSERAKKETPLTSKFQPLQDQILPQCLGQLRRTLDPDIIFYATSQETEFVLSKGRSCRMRGRSERAERKAPLTFKVQLLQGRILLQRFG
jgi:hypothetical protein